MTETTASQPSPAPRPSIGHLLFTLLWRGLLLSLGGMGAAFLGVGIAHFYPNPNPTLPWIEQILQRSGSLWTQVRQPLTAGSSSSLLQPSKLTATLPSDIFFKDSQSALRPETKIIFDNVIADLRNYQGATLLIAVHTDNLGDPNQLQELSLRQAQAFKQYLAPQLPPGYHWLVVGYGDTQPLAENTTNTNRQRNRRVELKLVL